MAFGVFIHRFDSIYDDTPAERYHFPQQYLSRVEACIGKWIVYYEPTKVRNTRGYFAVARVAQVLPDKHRSGMFFATIEPGTYLDFVEAVPFITPDGQVVERGLLNDQGSLSGRRQAAVRTLSQVDFARIISLGLPDDMDDLPRLGSHSAEDGFSEEQSIYVADLNHERERLLTSRSYRDRMFRRSILKAYDSRCAFTGLRLLNGGGRAEVEAAHIRPVEQGGPDVVGNGIALSGTIHWMFDRGLLSLSDEFDILISRQLNDLSAVEAILNRDHRALSPLSHLQRPLPQFLEWHRSNCFKH
ncbi:HNH endonuclease [Jiella mangrovi]|uniref:HNH endonuclease n=1 Tax=Jiella mangrovi TaxID=2821407 RepID=A0ABS4BLJ5_9HYPH|nr:HNH endonuclease [Jiella mangrovi]MBP0617607.1 HNH endonuclease [Jiella mangrovi]